MIGKRWRAKVSGRKIIVWRSQLTISLPSKYPEYRFEVSFDIAWTVRASLRSRSEPIIIQAVRHIAETVLADSDVIDCRLARQDIAAEFAKRLPISLDKATVFGVNCRIDVEPESRESALQLEGLLRQSRIDRAWQQYAKSRVAFLRKEVLSDPANAQLYLIASADGTLHNFPDDDALRKLIDNVSWWEPKRRWVLVAQLLQDYLSNLSQNQTDELLTAFAAAVETLGDSATANRLRAETSEEGFDTKPSNIIR